MSVSLEVTSNDLLASWNTWLFQSNDNVSVVFGQRVQWESGNKEKKRDVPMEMERVETCIPIVYCKLNN